MDMRYQRHYSRSTISLPLLFTKTVYIWSEQLRKTAIIKFVMRLIANVMVYALRASISSLMSVNHFPNLLCIIIHINDI